MDLFRLIDTIAKADPEVYDRFDSRRAVFRHFLGFGQKATAAALPLALSTLFSKAYGQTSTGSGFTPAIISVLNLALQLEYLEYYYYDTALNSSNLLSTEQATAFTIIRNDERLHINVLRGLLKSDAVADPTRAGFDYTGARGGSRTALFPTLGATFTSLSDFLAVGQQFVDTGVRAYKGSAPNLMTQKDLLEAAVNIHSVEARHAARIRSLRRSAQGATATTPKNWITPDETPTLAPLPNNGVAGAPTTVGPYNAGNPSTGTPSTGYPAEDNVSQSTGATLINIQTFMAALTPPLVLTPALSATAAAEAFDEPLDAATVRAIAKNFVPSTSTLFNA